LYCRTFYDSCPDNSKLSGVSLRDTLQNPVFSDAGKSARLPVRGVCLGSAVKASVTRACLLQPPSTTGEAIAIADGTAARAIAAGRL